MAHNKSRAQIESIEGEARAAALRPLVDQGWHLCPFTGALTQADTVLGSHERGEQLLVMCRKHGCFRRYQLDLRAALREGHGERTVRELIRILQCGHWHGCGLENVERTFPAGRPLLAYVYDEDAFVAIICKACGARWLVAPREAIRRLKDAQRGNGNTGVLAVGKAMRGPCSKCHTHWFTSELIHVRAGK